MKIFVGYAMECEETQKSMSVGIRKPHEIDNSKWQF